MLTDTVTPDLFSLFIALGCGYILGSIPSGLILTKFFTGIDIRETGSGNIGATNVLRTGDKKLAIATLLLDAAKGAIPVLIFIDPIQLATFAAGGAVLGHIFPIWLKFKGGKGVATLLGSMIALSWPISIIALVTWIISAFVFRYSSLAAIIAIAVSATASLFIAPTSVFIFTSIFGMFVVICHHENITRLLAGTESKIGDKKK